MFSKAAESAGGGQVPGNVVSFVRNLMKFFQNILWLLCALPAAGAELGAGRCTVMLTNGGFARVACVQMPSNFQQHPRP